MTYKNFQNFKINIWIQKFKNFMIYKNFQNFKINIHGGNFLQKISRLQLKLSKVSYKSIFPLQNEFIRWVIKFPKV